MELFTDSGFTANFWFIAGVVLVCCEVFLVSGVGFLFAGLGAIALGALINFGLMEVSSYSAHFAYFFFFTIVWAVILWAPLKRIIKKSGSKFDNIIGTEGVVESAEGLKQGRVGNVKWSGAAMRARISPQSKMSEIASGAQVFIHEIKDGVLIVDVTEPKKNKD